MPKLSSLIVSTFLMALVLTVPAAVSAQTKVNGRNKVTSTASPSATMTPTITPEPTLVSRPDLTQKTQETVEPLVKLLNDQKIGKVWPFNPIKYAIRGAVAAGVPANTIVLLLLLPVIAAVIAATRQVVGVRGFGIFLPAALAVVFLAIGPIVGVGLFLLIVTVSTFIRIIMRKLKLKLQYLPRMALILWFVSVGVLGILFATPIIRYPDITNVSIFAVLILALLTEDFIKVQLGKSVRTAVDLTFETIILAIISYLFLTFKPLQEYALLNPEKLLLIVLVIDVLLARYIGLRILEVWRFRKLINGK